MAEFATLARPYARAAFDAARTDGDDGLARWTQMLGLLAAAVQEASLAEELGRPERTAEGKAQLLIDLLGDDLGDKGRNLVKVVASNKRLELLPEIAVQFEELRSEHDKTLEVEVVSARETSEADLQRLSQKLAAKFDKQVSLSHRVDANLIGGAIIRAGDTIIDGSVRGRLDKLAQTLQAG